MPIFNYKAKTKPDVFKTGTIEAESERAAANKLLQLKYHPISITQESKGKLGKYKFFQKLSGKEVYIFLRQLSNLIQAGLPLAKALKNISTQSSNPKLRVVVQSLKEQVQKGKTLSEALSRFPTVFSTLEINIIRSGESSGTLTEVISKLADLKESDIGFSTRIKSAMAYPILLLVVGFLTLFLLTTFVLPKFVVMFQDLGQELPLLTKMLIAVSLFFKKFWVLLVILSTSAIVSFFSYIKTKPGKLWFDTFILKIPLLKGLIVKIQTSRFARTLGSLIENGVPILVALQVVSEVASNAVFANEIKRIHTEVSRGLHISETLKNSNLFDRNTIDLISVGEQSSKLDEMLLRIAIMNETESSQQIESFVFMLEPALILFLGGIVGVIVMAILLPIFGMNFRVQ